ncbi:MAG: hypothetical protein VX335_03385 [Pseudomonadota bacterium]|nr:hypothetical protein [Pseudomonadota bacterium]
MGLFVSLSTILCYALPIILVFLGMGVVFASLTSRFPLIPWLAEMSSYLFFFCYDTSPCGWLLYFLKTTAVTC